MLRPAPLCLGDRNPESGGVGVCSGLACFLAGMTRTEKGRKKAAAFLGRKIRRPLRARDRMESDGKGMSAKGTALAGLGLRYPPQSSGCRSRIRHECPKDARNGALELAKRRGRVILCPRVRKRLYGRLNASARVWVLVAEAKQEGIPAMPDGQFRDCQTPKRAASAKDHTNFT